MDGRSLIPVAQNPGIERGRELLIEEPGFEAIRTERYMYAEHNTGEKELYDLLKDPFELQSRHNAPAYASVKAQLADRLHELRELRRRQLPHPALAADARPSSRPWAIVLRPERPRREILRGRCRRRTSRSFGRSSRLIWRESHQGGAIHGPSVRVRACSHISHECTGARRERVHRALADMMNQFESYQVVPDRIIDAGGDRVIVEHHRTAKSHGVQIEDRIAHVITVRGGRISRIATFRSLEEALEAAGLSE